MTLPVAWRLPLDPARRPIVERAEVEVNGACWGLVVRESRESATVRLATVPSEGLR
jgi:hypothetical protein